MNTEKRKHIEVVAAIICKVKNGNLTLLEHEAAKWLTRNELGSVKWLPADEEVVKKIRI